MCGGGEKKLERQGEDGQGFSPKQKGKRGNRAKKKIK